MNIKAISSYVSYFLSSYARKLYPDCILVFTYILHSL